MNIKPLSNKSKCFRIYFENHLFGSQKFIKALQKHRGPLALITDKTVASLYQKPLLEALGKQGLAPCSITFQGGEATKNRATKKEIEDKLFAKRLGRDTLLILMGGGVTTDLGGFVAATYLRGVPYISIPTSLLGMVDASIGGKTGINTAEGKNIIGAIYPPAAIFIDSTLLSTLPDREILYGSAEIIKLGLVCDKNIFKVFQENYEQWQSRDPALLQKLIEKSVKQKKKIVGEDVADRGKRRLLNFGHTIGHALEAVEKYTLAHGAAVAIGLLTEAFISRSIGRLSPLDFEKVERVIREMKLPIQLSAKVSIAAMKKALRGDKKGEKGSPRFVILQKIGKAHPCGGEYCTPVREEVVEEALNWMINEFCR